MVIPGAAFFIIVELTFFAANLPKIESGGWLPLVVGAMFFTILTTWRRGRLMLARAMREDRVLLRRYINRMIDERPNRVPGTAVFLTPSLDTVPTALLNNAEYNHVVHEHVVLVQIETVDVPHVDEAERVTVELLRLGFVTVTARYGYQDEPDVVPRSSWPRGRGSTSTSTTPRTTSTTSRSCRPAAPAWPAGASACSPCCTRTRPRSRARTASRPTACSRSGRTSSSRHAVVARTSVR